MTAVSFLAEEIRAQPSAWRRAAELARREQATLPRRGARIAVVGCGTSWFVAQAFARLREAAGHGETDAFTASEMPAGRAYDQVVAISRSGTTTEVLELLAALRRPGVATIALTGDGSTPIADVAERTVVLDFADERSVVQTLFATTTLALLRAHLGEDVEPLAAQAERALADQPDPVALEAGQLTFLGEGFAAGLAQEAALKLREATQSWTEAYPSMEYRHGPIAIACRGRAVWSLGPLPRGLADEIAATGAALIHRDGEDPQATLVRVHRVAEALAERRGLDPDRPRHLSRSVTLAP